MNSVDIPSIASTCGAMQCILQGRDSGLRFGDDLISYVPTTKRFCLITDNRIVAHLHVQVPIWGQYGRRCLGGNAMPPLPENR